MSRTFGVVLDTSGSMSRDLLAKALGSIASYAIAREVVAMRDTWADIEALDTKVAATVQYEMMFETTRLLRFCT